MGKNIKFFKKLTSLVLAGLTIFSSVPAKAWKEEDPRDAAESEVYNMLSQGYKNIFCGDYNNCEIGINMDTRNTSELSSLGYVVKHPFWFCGTVMKGLFSSEGILLSIDSAYYKELLKIMEIKSNSVVQLDMPCPKDNEDDEHYIYKKLDFPNLVKVNIRVKKSGSRGFQQTSILVDKNEDGLLQGTFSSCKEIKLVYVEGNGILEFLDDNGQKVELGDIDLFPACKHGVIIICDTEDQFYSFKKIMSGDKGKRHKVFLKKDFKKFDEANREPLKLDKSTEVITLESTDKFRIEMSQFHESKNIIIPKNVKKIEKDAFKNAGLCGVTFEEGMTEIEFCDGCFAGCPLVKFELPKSLKKITLGKDCFKDCSNKVAIVNYIRAEQTRIRNEEIERLRKEEEKRRIEAERKRKEEEERKRKEEEEKMKRQKEELETWKKETKQKIEKEKAKLKKEISGDIDGDGDEIFDKNSLKHKKIEATGVKKQCEKELKKFLENHPEYITDKDIKLFEFNNKLIEKEKTKFSSNKISEINKIRADLISKEDKLLRSKLKVAKLKVKLYDEKIKSKKNSINLLDARLKDLEKVTEIQKDYEIIMNLIVENETLKNDLKLRIEEAEKQKEEYEKLKNELSEKEKLQKEIGIGHEKTAKELNDQREEQERITKQQDEEKGNLERKEQKLKEGQNKLEEEQQKLKKEKIIWNSVKFLGKAVLTLSPFAPFIPVVGPIITSVVQPIITSSVSAVTSIVGLVANLTVDICKSLFTSKSKKAVPQKPSNSTSATPV